MTIALTEEHRALADAVSRWAAANVDRSVVAAAGEAEVFERPAWWSSLAAQGLLGLHVREDVGGTGSGMLELAVTAERLGYACAPGGFVATTIVSALIDRHGDDALRGKVLPGLIDGTAVAGVELVPGDLIGIRGEHGLSVSGAAAYVVSGDEADLALLAVSVDGETVWVLVEQAEATINAHPSADATRRLAGWALDGVTIPTERIVADLTTDAVRQIAAVVLTAEAAGNAAWTLDIAAEHAKVREQFGQPIGKFQAVKHMAADMLIRSEQAKAASWDAAVSIDEDAPADEQTLAAAVAVGLTFDAAVENAKSCIQTLGGIGYTWEHPAHWYLKRALAARSMFGGTTSAILKAGEMALEGKRRTLGLALDEDVAAPHRAAVREFLGRLETMDERQRREAIVDSGYAEPHWPEPYGRNAGAIEQIVIAQELRAANVKPHDIVIGKWILPTIIHHGTPEQQSRFMRPSMYGDLVWCQLFSEPGAGSDLAAIQMKAERVEGGWSLTGQKIWTTNAHDAHVALCIARTDRDAPKHDGITAFIVDMQAEGVDVRPLTELTGKAMFNEVFLTDVFVADDMVIGQVNDGWRAARATLTNERVAMSSGSTMGLGVEGVLKVGAMMPDAVVDPITRHKIGEYVCEGQSLALIGHRSTIAKLTEVDAGAGASVRKLVGMSHAQEASEFALTLLGQTGAIHLPDRATSLPTRVAAARALTIAGGTTEVQKNIVAERVLGLPRDDAR